MEYVEELLNDDIDNLDNPDQYCEETVDTEVADSSVGRNAVAGSSGQAEKSSERASEHRLTQLPITRIRSIMKLDPDLQITSMEATFLVAKATELFIESLARESYVHTAQAKKKTVQKKDVDMAIASVDALMFLEGVLN